ncbi:MAG: glycosyltransferase, partial [Vicinamibacterales bacterium]
MKASAGDVVMLVENCFPADSRVRNEAFTLRDSGFNVSVIALRKEGEPARETVEGVSVYRVPRLTVFKKLPGAAPSAGRRALNAVQSVFGYVTEYSYFTAACLALSLWIAARRGADVVHAHNPPDTLFVVGGLFRLLGKKYVFDHHDLS